MITYTIDPDLEVTFTPQFSKTLGEAAYSTPVNTGASALQQTSGNTVDSYFQVHEAYASYRLTERVRFYGGRMTLSYGDELLIGALDWQNVGRSFDGFKLTYKSATFSSELFSTKIQDNNTITHISGDVDFHGLYNTWSLNEYLKNVDLYALYKRDATLGTTHLGIGGARVSSKLEDFDYRIEYTKEFGNALPQSNSAEQFDIESGMTFGELKEHRIALEYFLAGKHYQQLYPTLHKWLGYADVLGRKNISGFVLHGSSRLSEKLMTKIDYHRFSRVSSDASVYKLNGTTALGTATGSSSDSVGSEIDLTVIYAVKPDLSFSGGYSIFHAGDYIRDQLPMNNAHFYYLQMEVKL